LAYYRWGRIKTEVEQTNKEIIKGGTTNRGSNLRHEKKKENEEERNSNKNKMKRRVILNLTRFVSRNRG
jgi:hypothetical protein